MSYSLGSVCLYLERLGCIQAANLKPTFVIIDFLSVRLFKRFCSFFETVSAAFFVQGASECAEMCHRLAVSAALYVP